MMMDEKTTVLPHPVGMTMSVDLTLPSSAMVAVTVAPTPAVAALAAVYG